GLNVKSPGYNIFVAGGPGTGKNTLAMEMVKKKASTCAGPSDWCYVNNFQNPDRPLTIQLPSGMGKKFTRDMKTLFRRLTTAIPKALNNEDIEVVKNQIMTKFYEDTTKMYTHIEEIAHRHGFSITRNQAGIITVPTQDGQPLTSDQFASLSEEQKDKYINEGKLVQERINEAIRHYKELERGLKERLRLLEQETIRQATAAFFADQFYNYRQYEKVVVFLENMQLDIIENSELFVEPEESQVSAVIFKRLDKRHLTRRYQVNLLVDNSELKNAPVIIENNPTYANLMGSIEYEGEFGVLATDFTKIRGGSLHRANGGYLIINFMDMLRNLLVWDALKRVLKNQELTIESIYKSLSLGAGETLQPEPIPLNVKVILIGDHQTYHILSNYDDDFKKLFKIKAEFDNEMNLSDASVYQYAGFSSSVARKLGLRHLTREAVAGLVDYGTWLSEDQNKLSTDFGRLVDIVTEANAWADNEKKDLIEAEDITRAIQDRAYRSNMVEEKLIEMIDEGTLVINTSDSKVGEINGLAVYAVGDYYFGKPSRITAKTFAGEKGVVNIEREVRMSGTIHNKGVLILSGYLGAKYAQDRPLSLSASLTFEQTYGGIEGDSASSAELLSIISSLSGVPINQGIAVTGSVNQNGEIQPIGGVNQKIEGFFRVCEKRGLTGHQGVIIPETNVKNLILAREVIDAVSDNKFHIWAVNNIDDAIEIIMNVPAGKTEKNAEYTSKSVHYLVNARLTKWADKSKELFGVKHARHRRINSRRGEI
ncbi:MAG: Lon protease family protein, partial [Chitinophagales bacterium]